MIEEPNVEMTVSVASGGNGPADPVVDEVGAALDVEAMGEGAADEVVGLSGGLPSEELARLIATAADERKATDIVTLDLRGISDVTDFFVIATAANPRRADAIVDRITEATREGCGARPLSVEGRAGLRWVLLDYGTVVVHVFLQEVRDYYRLERLWGDASRVRFGLEGEDPHEPPRPDDSVGEVG